MAWAYRRMHYADSIPSEPPLVRPQNILRRAYQNVVRANGTEPYPTAAEGYWEVYRRIHGFEGG